jgi:hypothetical protein
VVLFNTDEKFRLGPIKCGLLVVLFNTDKTIRQEPRVIYACNLAKSYDLEIVLSKSFKRVAYSRLISKMLPERFRPDILELVVKERMQFSDSCIIWEIV